MNKNSTLKGNKLIGKKERVPSLKTLDYLKMFARVYYVEKSLPEEINEMCIN